MTMSITIDTSRKCVEITRAGNIQVLPLDPKKLAAVDVALFQIATLVEVTVDKR